MMRLTVSRSNTKLGDTPNFNLPAGHSCPGALDCLAKVNKETGKLQQKGKFRCFAASIESLRKNVRTSRNNNFLQLVKLSKDQMVEKITEDVIGDLRRREKLFRIHASGDFFNRNYFQAWIEIARQNQDILFYAYTKSINYWIESLDSIPDNLVLTASRGGRYDHLIDEYKLREAVVVKYSSEAQEMGIPIDSDDSLAYDSKVEKFALLLHGTQAKGSEESKAVFSRRRKKA
ncbi:GP88 family protein [Flammeovirga aprica]|uniref:Gene product 88 domain-containing protein n=1 Tax=Flammeovirga aprica JL-4 TaxID=694437 RepID=A0A7X9P0C6_9BACT|nr:hypothetical protein [Flammeovirga aprica]NME67224.1 hypothetical protein [Flammeovirga aprica JL-4]